MTHSAKRQAPVVAIDGPAGAGKSTVASRLADRLEFVLVDTGALYRGVALSAIRANVDFGDGPALGALTARLEFSFSKPAGQPSRLYIGSEDCADAIRTPEISTAASYVSSHPEVRAALLGLQRKLGEHGGVVLEGRDIGTVVFPDAEVKVFLTADAALRARRRVEDLQARGMHADYDETLADVEARDRRDSSRPVAPLRAAHDATVLDSSRLEIDAVVDRLVELVNAAS